MATIARTQITADGERWLINGQTTYQGRQYRGWDVEGLLMNSIPTNWLDDGCRSALRMVVAGYRTTMWWRRRTTSCCTATALQNQRASLRWSSKPAPRRVTLQNRFSSLRTIISHSTSPTTTSLLRCRPMRRGDTSIPVTRLAVRRPLVTTAMDIRTSQSTGASTRIASAVTSSCWPRLLDRRVKASSGCAEYYPSALRMFQVIYRQSQPAAARIASPISRTLPLVLFGCMGTKTARAKTSSES